MKRFRNLPKLNPGPPCADASASCTPNQTIIMVANARTMCTPIAVIEGAAVAASDWHPCAINSKSPVPMFRALWFSSALAYSVRLREEIRRPTAGCGYVGVVVAFVSRRVTECRFHRVLLLLLGNDLLQGKI